MNRQIKTELEKWESKAIYDVKFREDTKANLKKLEGIMREALDHFVCIFANTESLSYKIGRFLVENKVKTSDISIIHESSMSAYFGDRSAQIWARKDGIMKFMEVENYSGSIKDKWVVIPHVTIEMTEDLAHFFVMELRKSGAIGLIVSASGTDNFVELLCQSNNRAGFYQFPKADFYKPRPKKLKDDGY